MSPVLNESPNWHIKTNDGQQIVCIFGPSGTGKSFLAEYLQKYCGYKIINQITTRQRRPDDKHYLYTNNKDFIKKLLSGNYVGYFDGDLKTLTGVGYGYDKDYLLNELKKYNKIIIFPSVYELLEDDFANKYGSSIKIGITFKDENCVEKRARQAGKTFSVTEMNKRKLIVKTLSGIMENYLNSFKDKTFYLLYSDLFGNNILESKKNQIDKVLSILKINKTKEQAENIENYIGGN